MNFLTEGSSQGLFVIVAIVIFGLFVAICYMIFSDTLQPALANIFTDSINHTWEQIEGSPSIFYFKNISPRRTPSESNGDYIKGFSYNSFVLGTKKSLELNGSKSSNYGFVFGENGMEFVGGDIYKFTFEVRNIHNLQTIGGHDYSFSDTISLKVNGKKVLRKWHQQVDLSSYDFKEDFIKIEHIFKIKDTSAEPFNRLLFVQPNRELNAVNVPMGIDTYQHWEAEFKNVQLVKL